MRRSDLIRFVNEHSIDGRPVVLENGDGWLKVRSVVVNGATKNTYESITIIPATVRAARHFLGY